MEMNPGTDVLLVCAGSGVGRVPFAMVTRASGADVVQNDRWLTFASKGKEGPTWSFRILLRGSASAETLADSLKRQEVYSLSPNDFGIQTIVFYRDDWGAQPRWIGGDIAGAEVNSSLYQFGGNNVYRLKEELHQMLKAATGHLVPPPV